MTSLQKAFEHSDQFARQWMKAVNVPGLAIAVTDRHKLLRVSICGFADLAAQLRRLRTAHQGRDAGRQGAGGCSKVFLRAIKLKSSSESIAGWQIEAEARRTSAGALRQ
jgi:hypothetical protein